MTFKVGDNVEIHQIQDEFLDHKTGQIVGVIPQPRGANDYLVHLDKMPRSVIVIENFLRPYTPRVDMKAIFDATHPNR